jgi:hypothetical protein
VGGDAAFWRTLKSGAFVLAGACGASSSTAKLIISTILETSFFIFSGRVEGSCFPTSFRLHRYIARANSGKCSCPDRVVSARVLFQSQFFPYYMCALAGSATSLKGVLSVPYSHPKGNTKQSHLPNLTQRVPIQFTSHQQIPTLIPTQRLALPHRTPEQRLKLRLILCRDKA